MGRPVVLDDDDDFEVDLEGDDLQSGIPVDEVEIEDKPQGSIEAFNIPDGDDEGDIDGGEGRPVENDEADEEIYRARSEADAANARALRTEAESIMREAEGHVRYVQSQIANADVSLGSLGLYLNQAYAQLAQAKDAGDTASEIAIEREIRNMEGLKSEIQAAKAQAPSADAVIGQAKAKVNNLYAQNQKQAPQRGTNVGGNVVAVVPIAEKWAKQNSWMKTNQAANKFVLSKSAQLVKEGWDMNTPGFYSELSRQVNMAGLGAKAQPLMAKQQPLGQKQKVRSPVAPARSSMSSGSPQRQQSQTKYTLTANDQAAMRRMNLDPSNVKHRKAFAGSRLESGRRSS